MAKVHILGAGAIGISMAHVLSRQHTITLLTRRDYTSTFSYKVDHEQHTFDTEVINLNKQTPALDSIKDCFICVKAYQLKDAFDAIEPFLSPRANIFITHNGMSDLSAYKQRLKAQQGLFFFSTSMGGLKLNDTTVQATGAGETYLGYCNMCAKQRLDRCFSNFFQTLLPHSRVHKNIELLRWQKLLINIAINPLTAVHQIKNGQLRQPQFSSDILNLLNEACAVAHALNIDISLAQALNSAYQVMMRTQHNSSSMAQDKLHGRKTEIDAICGYIVKQGQYHNITTPYNQSMLEQLHGNKAE